MSAGWIAGSVRARLLTQRRLGRAGARAVAAAGATEAAVARLGMSPYEREVRPGMTAAAARRAIGSVCLWHLRVLAGWLPPRSSGAVRVFAGRFELVNIADRLAALGGEQMARPYELGALAVAWPRVAIAATAREVRVALAASAWGDPGTVESAPASIALEARWTSWLAAAVPHEPEWAAGAAAIVAARSVAVGARVPVAARADLGRQLGRPWDEATDVVDLMSRLPRSGAWVLEGLDSPDALWRAEGRWWRRVDDDAAATLRARRPGPALTTAAAARLVADAWRAQAALEAAAWGRAGVEVFDAVA